MRERERERDRQTHRETERERKKLCTLHIVATIVCTGVGGGDMMGRFLWILESVRLLSFVPSTFSTVVDFDTSLPQQYIGTTDSTRHLKGSDPLISEITIF